MAERASKPMLDIRGLNVFYGASHALQDVALSLPRGVLAVVGRNGMGKTTLCNTIVGLQRAASGAIRFEGRDITALPPHAIHRAGVGLVPQGRRVWPSLSVDEHLRLCAQRDGAWGVERVYATFPRLAERRNNGGAQLSGGEQQMLAIGRALLGNPKLLVMDEPTEGLAPLIVDQVTALLAKLAEDEDIAVLVIEQNIGVATAVAQEVAVMVNGAIARRMPAQALANDRALQQALLGVSRHAEAASAEALGGDSMRERMDQVFQIQRGGESAATVSGRADIRALPNRWGLPTDLTAQRALRAPALVQETAMAKKPATDSPFAIPLAERLGRVALIVGTFDTKGRELNFLRDRLRSLGIKTRTVDVSTSGKASTADVPPAQIASAHPQGGGAVFSGDRGKSVGAMAEAFARWIERERDIGGIISAGGSGGTALVTPGMRKLPVGVPKIMISTIASGDVARYVGASDIMMLHSVADVQGLNSITERVLGNGAHALAGMIAQLPTREARAASARAARPAIGLTMFGVTTPCVQALTQRLEGAYDCLVFHATGTGGRAMENLADSGLLAAIIDVTTTEIADMCVGGVFAADADRFGSVIRTRLPYVGSVGALDMVNFGPRASVPEQFKARKFVVHNPQVTLMRTTRDENRVMGEWIAARLNLMEGPVRFLLPEGGVSALDAPGQAFHDPEADNALFEALEKNLRQSAQRKLVRVAAHINDVGFVDALAQAFDSIAPKRDDRRAPTRAAKAK